MRALTWPIRAAARLARAVKFKRALGYPWHLAWSKAAR